MYFSVCNATNKLVFDVGIITFLIFIIYQYMLLSISLIISMDAF